MNDDIDLKKLFWSVFGGVIACAMLALVGYPLYRTIFADGRVSYCYLSATQYHVPTMPNVVMYDVWGFRNWRSDRLIAQNLKSVEEAKSAAAAYGCELK